MKNKIQNVKITDASNNKTNITETFTLNTNNKNVETFDVGEFFNNDYVTKEKASSMLQDKMNAVAKAHPNTSLIKNSKGIETDKDGHHYLTFTLKDNKGNREIFTYRVNDDNTVKNTVHYKENANGTHVRWREGMKVDSNVSGFTKADANAFKNSGDAITNQVPSSNYVSKEEASSMLEQKMNKLKTLNPNMTLIKSTKGLEKDSAGHYYLTFTLKDNKGNSKLYTYRINGDNKIVNTVHYEEYADGTHVRWREGMSVDSNISGFTKEDANSFKKSGDKLPNNIKPNKSLENYITEEDAITGFDKLIKNKAKIYNIVDPGKVKKDADGHYYRQFTATDKDGRKYLFNFRINANKVMKCIVSNVDEKDGTYMHNNADTNISEIKSNVNKDYYIIRRFNLKTGEEIYKSPLYKKIDQKSTDVPAINYDEITTDILNKIIADGKAIKESTKEQVYSKLSNYYKVDTDRLESTLKKDLDVTDNSLTMDDMITYICVVESKYNSNNFNNILDVTKKLIAKDSKRMVLYLSPTIKNGTLTTTLYKNNVDSITGNNYIYKGDYLEFYNPNGCGIYAPLDNICCDTKGGEIYSKKMDEKLQEQYIKELIKYYDVIQKERGKFTNNFKNTIDNNLNRISIIYSSNDSNIEKIKGDQASVTYDPGSNMTSMLINGQELIKKPSSFLGTYTHECGHVYDFNNGPISFSEAWKDIYSSLKDDDTYPTIISDYAKSSEKELYADLTRVYFENPNSLKMVKINVPVSKTSGIKYDNLYEYFNDLYKD